MSDTTARLTLPMIVPGQAQKEVSHNEALVLLDTAVQASAVALGIDAPPTVPTIGACWVIGDTPTGGWAGHARELAVWTEGGWRFVRPTTGFSVWVVEAAAEARFVDGNWVVRGPSDPIADPGGGGTIDAQARATIAAILTALREQRLIAS